MLRGRRDLVVDQLNILALAVPTTEVVFAFARGWRDKAQLATVERRRCPGHGVAAPRRARRWSRFSRAPGSNLRKVTEEQLSSSSATSSPSSSWSQAARVLVTVELGLVPRVGAFEAVEDAVGARSSSGSRRSRLTDVGGGPQDFLAASWRRSSKKSAPEVEFLADELPRRPRRAAALHLDGTKETLDAVDLGFRRRQRRGSARVGGVVPAWSSCGKHRRNARPVPGRHGPVCRSAPSPSLARARAVVVGARRDEKRDGVFRRAVQVADNGGRIFKLVADFLVTFDKVQDDARREAAAESALSCPRSRGGGAVARRRRCGSSPSRSSRATAKDAKTPDGFSRGAPVGARARRARWISWTPCTTSSRRRRRAWTPRSPPPARWRA